MIMQVWISPQNGMISDGPESPDGCWADIKAHPEGRGAGEQEKAPARAGGWGYAAKAWAAAGSGADWASEERRADLVTPAMTRAARVSGSVEHGAGGREHGGVTETGRRGGRGRTMPAAPVRQAAPLG